MNSQELEHEDEVNELYLYATNTEYVYKTYYTPLAKEIELQCKTKTYNGNNFKDKWLEIADVVAQSYCREHCSKDSLWSDIFIEVVRVRLAVRLMQSHFEEMQVGNFII